MIRGLEGVDGGCEGVIRPVEELIRGCEDLDRGVDGADRGCERVIGPVDDLIRGCEGVDTPVEALDRGCEDVDRAVDVLDTPVRALLGRGADLGYTVAPMRGFFDLVESRAVVALTSELGPTLAPGALDALRHAGILRPDGREGIEEISVPDLVRALRALYGAESRGLPVPARLETHPNLLGWCPGPRGERAVVLVAGGSYGVLSATARSERTLALVPTSRHVKPELRAKHGPQAHCTLEVLEESVIARDGRLVLASAPPPTPAPTPAPAPAPTPTPTPTLAPLTGASRWSDVRISHVDATTVRVDVAGRTRRVTHVDLGMANSVNREPTRVWELLQAFCSGNGTFKSWSFGNAKATKKTVSRLRQELRALFGIDEAPFFPYRSGEGWRARFMAGDRLPEDDLPLSPEGRAVLARAGKAGKAGMAGMAGMGGDEGTEGKSANAGRKR